MKRTVCSGGDAVLSVLFAGAVLLCMGCAADDPEETVLDGGTGTDGGGGGGDAGCVEVKLPASGGDNASCTALATDYTPREQGSASDSWSACISDDGQYHPFETSISSIGRVDAFERIAALLFTGGAPGAQAFLDARVIYAEEEGLESRVTRREDEHYPTIATKCADMTEEELAQNSDRCVGPAQIQPLLNDAFKAGAEGKDPLVNAAKVEAGLLWFLYVSVFKESTTCTTTQKDCDSSYAYYTGGADRSGGLGLARYTRALSVQAHDRVWDGILAVRCWRDLDNPTGAATDTALRDKALAQMDRALLRGVALIVRSRLAVLAETCDGTVRAANGAFTQILGAVLDREATTRDSAKAQELRTELEKAGAADAKLDAAAAALDAIFPCP
jgi:hypothetical protein